jgi:Flp pilus assembly pilin Flp
MTHLPLAALTLTLVALSAAPGCWLDLLARRARRRGDGDERGQSTVEYALILLGAAAVALVVVAWVTRTDLIGRLFDTVVGRILQQAG